MILNEKDPELEKWTHEEVILLKKRINNELILTKIFDSWAKRYQETILKTFDELTLVFNIECFIADLQAYEFNLVEHSKLVDLQLIQMVGLKLLELDYKDEILGRSKVLINHLEYLKAEVKESDKPNKKLKFKKDLHEIKEFLKCQNLK